MNTQIPIESLRRRLEAFVAEYPNISGSPNFWRPPLLAAARADRRFDRLPKIASDEHWLPTDLLTTAKSVIVYFLPFRRDLVFENTPGKFPVRNWGLAYEATNRLIVSAAESIRDFLTECGYTAALTPATKNFSPEKLMARWSHKHLAHLAGLGRFGVNAQLITPEGCAGRIGSLVSDIDIGDHPLVTADELCRHKNGRQCLECVTRCPVGAMENAAESTIDRKRCFDRLCFNIRHLEILKGLNESTHICGKCAVGVPCSVSAP